MSEEECLTEEQLLESIEVAVGVLKAHPGFTNRKSKNCWHSDGECDCKRWRLSTIDDELWELIGQDEELTRAGNGF